MTTGLPSYYTRLAAFRDWFEQGVPILTYHKFGRRPRGVRLRGLYLPTRLWRTQLGEWRAAGFRSTTVEECRRRPVSPELVLTIDDGFRSVRDEALPELRRAGFTATLYLVADRIGGWNDWEVLEGEVRAPLMERGEVEEWLAAGQRIGAHTRTHPWLTRLSREAAREEIRGCRAKLEDWFGVEVTDFCYPYGDWNPSVRDEVAAAGFRTATTTDFGLNPPDADPLALRRITARHASRGWRGLREWWRRTCRGR